MNKSKLIGAFVAATLALSSTANAAFIRLPGGGYVTTGASAGASGVYALGGCVLAIMIAAVDKGNKYKKELTTDEAATCGLLYWIREANKRR